MQNIKMYAFVGTSGTGKSYRAQWVAGQRNINYIIDDGLLIKENKIIAGKSAKKAPTKVETVKEALFYREEQRKEIIDAIEKYKPESILILGTSKGMVNKIAENLKLPPIENYIFIEDVATQEEIEDAKRVRLLEGKHVIPVPTFEIKKDFSGFLLDPLQIFKTKSNNKPYITEKSIIRPTFSYLGNFKISDTVFKQIAEYVADKTDAIYKITKIRIENYGEGISLYLEVTIVYGYNVVDSINEFKENCTKEIEKLTAMNVLNIEIIVKNIYVPEKGE